MPAQRSQKRRPTDQRYQTMSLDQGSQTKGPAWSRGEQLSPGSPQKLDMTRRRPDKGSQSKAPANCPRQAGSHTRGPVPGVLDHRLKTRSPGRQVLGQRSWNMVLDRRSWTNGPTSEMEPQESREPAENQDPPAKSYQGSRTYRPRASGPRPQLLSADTVAASAFAAPVAET